MTARAVFHLTRRAALDLKGIHRRSVAEWGEETAARYISDLYAGMRRAASDPQSGRLRAQRSAPFLMVAARNHFIVYDEFGECRGPDGAAPGAGRGGAYRGHVSGVPAGHRTTAVREELTG